MRKVISLVVAVFLVTMIVATGVVAADTNPNASAKATALVGELDVMAVAEYPGDGWWDWFDMDSQRPVLTQQIKTSNAKDLFIDLSLQTGCFTTTEVKSKNMKEDTSIAACQIWVWITVDGRFGERVYPRWPVIFDSRVQKLSATLQGEIPAGWDGTPEQIVNEEIIELFIGTLSCHSFNFIVEDLEAGMHEIKVHVWATSETLGQLGSAKAVATVGLGSMTVEEVRMVKGDDIHFG